jgi:hypothetical protein
MNYTSPAALEMAIKEAAKASSMDTNRAISGFYFHRLLCRVFSEDDSPFVLKGGQGMLARTVNARATRDIDLLSNISELEEALKELKRLAAIDLGDFITFEFENTHPIKTEDEYRTGIKISFTPLLGTKRMQSLSIDLVADEIPCEQPELITPADRIDVRGILVFDYAAYPVPSAVADKLCAILETHDQRPSSRVKDLVDILVYATTEKTDGTALMDRIKIETISRKLKLPGSFSLPDQWHEDYGAVFIKLCRQTGIPSHLHSLNQGEKLARAFLNPALNGEVGGMTWNFQSLEWV